MNQIKKKPHGYWKKEENIVKEIQERVNRKLSLSSSIVDKEDKGLYLAGVRFFGSWGKAVEKAGYNYSAYRLQNTWNKDKIKEKILNRYENNLSISSRDIQKQDKNLYNACLIHFGSYSSAIQHIGLDYDSIRKQKDWSKEKVSRLLLNRYNNGLPMNDMNLQKADSALYSRSMFYFGSYRNALTSIGLDYELISKKINWSKEKIIKELISRYIRNEPMNSLAVQFDNKALYAACVNYFGNYRDACIGAGLDYEQIRNDIKTLASCGFRFELLLGNILSELNIVYSKGFSNKVRPDFVISHNKWIDAKLSEWTGSINSTVEKYEPYCRLLTIVYLRGNKTKEEMIAFKTRKISAYKLIKQLPKSRQDYYYKLIENLLIDIEEVERINV
ncbi:hypothetical protein [Metabacillus fastidiosus]|uniref:hypothetical protein n=1 Tax=Metabacillus fastidiosus TaxID=1458 RepID=UPI003D29B16E